MSDAVSRAVVGEIEMVMVMVMVVAMVMVMVGLMVCSAYSYRCIQWSS